MNLNAPNVEDVYELTALQQGMLYHTLRDPEVNTYFLQSGFPIEGLDPDAFRQAWRATTFRHAWRKASGSSPSMAKPDCRKYVPTSGSRSVW